MKSLLIQKSNGLRGSVVLPADKSISHRAAMFAALAKGISVLTGYSDAADPQSTLSCLQSLSVPIEQSGNTVTIAGVGIHGLKYSKDPLDCGNSGTTLRMLSGILAGQSFDSILTGDASLSARPMRRISDPLHLMGAEIELTDGHAPVMIHGRSPLKGMTYRLPIPSAQVKSCILLAGMYGDARTTVIEPITTRDHTERLLGLDVSTYDGERHIHVDPGMKIDSRNWIIPRDFSAAAFFLAGGSVIPNSTIRLTNVGLNPTRTALLPVLLSMGADIRVLENGDSSVEPMGLLEVHSSSLKGIDLAAEVVPNLIDEIPVLAVAATQAHGVTRIRNASELRVKETDRITAMVENLRALGANVEEHPDGMTISGPTKLQGAHVKTFDDHRIAMAMGIAGMLAKGDTYIDDPECASISFPDFWKELIALDT